MRFSVKDLTDLLVYYDGNSFEHVVKAVLYLNFPNCSDTDVKIVTRESGSANESQIVRVYINTPGCESMAPKICEFLRQVSSIDDCIDFRMVSVYCACDAYFR